MPGIDPIQELRERRLLPSDLLAMAKANNPNVEVTLDYPRKGQAVTIGQIYSPLVLTVVTERGEVVYERGPGEDWYAVFHRAGLLRRGAPPHTA